MCPRPLQRRPPKWRADAHLRSNFRWANRQQIDDQVTALAPDVANNARRMSPYRSHEAGAVLLKHRARSHLHAATCQQCVGVELQKYVAGAKHRVIAHGVVQPENACGNPSFAALAWAAVDGCRRVLFSPPLEAFSCPVNSCVIEQPDWCGRVDPSKESEGVQRQSPVTGSNHHRAAEQSASIAVNSRHHLQDTEVAAVTCREGGSVS